MNKAVNMKPAIWAEGLEETMEDVREKGWRIMNCDTPVLVSGLSAVCHPFLVLRKYSVGVLFLFCK